MRLAHETTRNEATTEDKRTKEINTNLKMTCLYLRRVPIEGTEAEHMEQGLYTPDYDASDLGSPSGTRLTTPPLSPRPRGRNSLKNDARVDILNWKLKQRTDKDWLVDQNILKNANRKGLEGRLKEASRLLEEKLSRRPRLNSDEMDQLYDKPKRHPHDQRQRNRSRSVQVSRSRGASVSSGQIDVSVLSASTAESSSKEHQARPNSPSLQAWARDRQKKTTSVKKSWSSNGVPRRQTKSEDKDSGSMLLRAGMFRPALTMNACGDSMAVSDLEGSRVTPPSPRRNGFHRSWSGHNISWDPSDWSTF